jgi:flagellar biosynthetic protein FliR
METIPIDPAWVIAQAATWGLVVARIGGLCATAPLTALPGVDGRIRALLALMLGVVLTPLIGPKLGEVSSVDARFVWLALTELLVGGLLGLSASLIVAGARQAGEIVSVQTGLSTASLFDPETGEELSAVGHLYGLIALMVFLAMGGPLALLSALIESYQAIPPGGFRFSEASVTRVFARVGDALALSLQAAAPVALAMTVAGVVMSWIGRLSPSVPLLALSLPVRSVVGILLVFLSLTTLAATFARAWSVWPWGF